MDQNHPFIPYSPLPLAPEGLAERARAVHALMNRRRTVRDFADTPVPFAVIADLVRAAGTAPSGARAFDFEFVGDDRVGIVADLTRVLAERGVSIDRLNTETVRASVAGKARFKVTAHLLVPAGADLEALRADLGELARSLTADVQLGERAA